MLNIINLCQSYLDCSNNQMQDIFHDRDKLRASDNQHRDQSRTESKIITRKQMQRPNNNIFKKHKDTEQSLPTRDKRYHSSHQLKFVKHASVEERDKIYATTPNTQQIHDNHDKNNKRKQSIKISPIKQVKVQKKKSLVFNKLSHRQKQQIREYLHQIKTAMDNQDINNQPEDVYFQIEAYISKIQQNNAKLLQVNYFFQKQFNQIMTQKQLAKKVDKCSKNNCIQCRYHLQKQNRWKQQKLQLQNQILKLREELKSVLSSRFQQSSQNPSIAGEYSASESSDIKNQLVRLRQELYVKDEEYMILLKEFNYLDTINKDLKNRMSKVMEEYKYLSIENRTLLNIKTKLIEKEVECTKYKDQRDYFKRKVIQNHKKNQQQKSKTNYNCKCTMRREEQSIFSLSSASNNLSSIDQASSLSETTSNIDESSPKPQLSTY